MIATAALLATALLTPQSRLSATQTSVDAPQIRCEIQMARWCIATFDGTISMTDAGATRLWRLQSRTDTAGGSLRIIEDKRCTADAARSPVVPVRLYERVESGIRIETYQLGDAGCKLEFRWSAAPGPSLDYGEVVNYGIIIDPATEPKQLYTSRR